MKPTSETPTREQPACDHSWAAVSQNLCGGELQHDARGRDLRYQTHPQEGIHWSAGQANDTSSGTPVEASMAHVVLANPTAAPQSTVTVKTARPEETEPAAAAGGACTAATHAVAESPAAMAGSV